MKVLIAVLCLLVAGIQSKAETSEKKYEKTTQCSSFRYDDFVVIVCRRIECRDNRDGGRNVG